MPPLPPTSTVADGEPSLPRPTIFHGSRTSSRASSRAGSAASSKPASSSASSPARRTLSTSSNETSSLPRRSSSRIDAGSSREAAAGPSSSSTSSTNIRNRSRSAEQPRPRIAIDPSDVVEISSDSSDDEEDFTVAWETDVPARPAPSDFFEIAGIRRAQPPAHITRSDLFSPPPVAGRPAEPLLFNGDPRGRLVGVSADPSTGDFLTRPMPIVRPPNSAPAPAPGPDDSFSIVGEQVAPRPPPRSDHPITDQRLRSSNLAMPTRSPPRSKPPPIEHPLLSKYTCPICFDAPKNLCITPCGHFFCGECLFQALKTQAVQRGTMEEEDALFNFGSIFSPFAPAGTFGAGRGGTGPPTAAGPNNGGAGRGGAAAGVGRGRGGGGPGRSGGGRGGSAGGGRGRNKPDPLAGQCPVCRNKIKGAFNGREKVGVLGLRLTTGKPVNDPREANGQMKESAKAEHDDGSSTISGSEDDEVVLPTSKKALAADSIDDKSVVTDESPRAARQRRRSSYMATSSTIKPASPAGGSRKRPRGSSAASATQTE